MASPLAPSAPSRRGPWIAAVLAVLVIAAVTVGIIVFTAKDAAPPQQSVPPPSFALTRTYPSLVVSTDPAKAHEQAAAKEVADDWAKAINDRDEDGLRSTMCSANASMNLSALAEQIDAGTMEVTSVAVSGADGLANIAFATDGKDSEGGVPLAQESGDWKICLQT
ncbi:hypothetical protein ABLG96_10065 [Nakamurella sp. A5-74]|uniref:DUF4878 domain-containing protein n=1 Tax=Nakamurella sp. A5-74 TaxID=3158264 RepID=A0AAU8DTD2_9ACTN